MDRLKGKVAIITGAAQGMGEAHARMFVKEGAQVILTDVSEPAGRRLADELGPAAMFIAQDVSRAADWQRVVEQGEARFGTINVLVNNAAMIGPVANILDLSEQDFVKVCDVNQLSVFLGMKAVVPSMLKAGAGSIVNISSLSGIVSNYGAPNAAYVASKFAVRGMSKQVAVDFADRNIRVNSVHPGFILTPMMIAATDEEGGAAKNLIPMRRLGKPAEVSNLVVFLASDESAFVTGAEHVIDGGMLAT
ncbi:MAG: glucose 1-dehydrogenase [Rhodocyclaceae bacterium]|jgi:3alpha(or 20beta)-hydroxysteroid dehydrogenase|nr:glucose 1-dehydrogenase [Rhodocyclaceae bacterium]